MRKLGVYGGNLPTKKSVSVTPSDVLIGGLIGLFERKYKVPFLCRNATEAQEIFGDHVVSSYYGWDALKGFFDNISGVDGKIYVKSHVGHTGSAYDAVAASAMLVDGSSASTLKLESAYYDELDYGVSGNRTGYTITNGSRFSTTCMTTGIAADTFVILSSVAGVKIGDLMKFVATGAGGATVYKKITSIDSGTNKVNFTGVFHATANIAAADVCTVLGFKIRTYRKTLQGAVTEVDADLGKIWCTMEPEVTDYYVNNVFANSKWLKASDQSSVSVLNLSFPIDVSTTAYLASGADGTAPTTASHWAINLPTFDNYPVRMLANCETTVVETQKAIETYCKARWDNPKTIYNISESQTKAQLITTGQGFQRADDVLGVVVSDWLQVPDPFSTSTIAPLRHIPNVGHVMGAWIRSIGNNGIHYIPAVLSNSLFGVSDISGYASTFSDDDRTDLADAGINIIQYVSGYGYVIRNFFTPSTSLEFKFANGIFMREYFKISAVDSLSYTENEPNNITRIKEGRMAILSFMYSLWDVGSTGSVPTGETFGQAQNVDGSFTKPEDHFSVDADTINNPQANINAGQRDYWIYFTYPSPAGSIKISVGLWLR